MKSGTQKEQLDGMMKRPIPRKRIGIIRLEMIKEGSMLCGMRRFSGPGEAAEMIRPLVKNRDRELMLVLSLDSKLQPMALEIVAVGGVDYCAVDVKNMFKHALLNNASYLICFHNHPSGVSEASRDDILITKRIQKAGDILGIRLLDHIIIGSADYFSLKEHGDFNERADEQSVSVA